MKFGYIQKFLKAKNNMDGVILNKVLPREGESQEIGKMASRAFVAKLPANWIEKELDGDSDFGLDYLVQLKNEKHGVSAGFYLQLKGTRVPSFVDSGREISYQFDSSTLNYYRRLEPAIMVAIVDLSANDKPRECPVYFKWLDEDFLDSISEKLEKNGKVNIRIPLVNVLDEGLDVLPYYRKRLEARNSLINLRRAVEQCSEDPVSHIEALAESVKEKPVILELPRDDSGAPWVINPKDLIAGKLCQISEAISANRIQTAEVLLEEVERENYTTKHEQAEIFFLKGKILRLKGEDDQAVMLFEQAYRIYNVTRYKVGFYESTLREGKIPKKEVLDGYIEDLNVKVYSECLLKSKCLVILGRESEAIKCLDYYPLDKVVASKLLVFTLSGNVNAFDDLSSRIVEGDLLENQKFLYYTLVGRRYFYRGINYNYSSAGEMLLPAKGKRGYDFKILKNAFKYIEIALTLAKDRGYPCDTYILFDVANLLFGFFNQEHVFTSYLESMLQGRPGLLPVISALIHLKFNARNYEDVLKLIDDLKCEGLEFISLQILANYHLGNKVKVVDLITNNKEYILLQKPQGYSVLFCVAAQCAYDLLDESREEEILEVVAGFQDGEELLAIYKYVKSCNIYPERRREFNRDLYDKYLSLNKSFSVAEQLYSSLDVENSAESLMICDLATSIVGRRELYPEECITLAFALSKHEKWSELEALCERVEVRGTLDNLWSLLKASALDAMGRSAEALSILDGAVSRDGRSVERAEYFVRMCVHLVFFEKASAKLECLLEKAAPDKQIYILELLLFIYSSSTKPSKKLIPTLLRYGRLVDQDDEKSEGHYLMSFLTMTNRAECDVSDYVDDFRDRLSKYTQKFPNSTVLRKGEVSLESGGDSILEEVRRIAGITDDQIKVWERNRNQIKSRKLPVPFALLPNFLDDVGDIFSAWVMCKYFGHKRKEYQLVHSKSASPEIVNGLGGNYSQVILDETSLIILNDLGVLELALRNLPGVVVSKSTYDFFSRKSHAVMGSIYSSIPRDIVQSLSDNLGSITLKGSLTQDESFIDRYELIMKELDAPVFCSDDLYMSMFLGHSGFSTVNSINIIDWLESKGHLGMDQKIIAVEKFCSFMVEGASLNRSHLLHSIGFNLKTIGGNIFDSGFASVFNAYFPLDKGYDNAIVDLGKFFSGLLNSYDGRIDLDGLEDVVNVWMVRYPSNDRIRMVSTWFVISVCGVKYIPEGMYLNRGVGEAKLWSLAKKLTVESDNRYTIRELITAICLAILGLKPKMASDVYDRVKFSFIEGSNERQMFSNIYIEEAVKVRSSQSQFESWY
ncbi:DUF4365 domain-containing protein [Microbulbifer sp. CNSA002]|uniref:DUF4365 domain-containing protein n=1 Tax=Microbulbifer sp. CNSA002 TaxID=3373604 RepID=UPI0039B6D664